jgi:hypothetical protein
LPGKGFGLRLPWRQVPEEIEANLADGDDSRVSGQFGKGGNVDLVQIGSFVRMYAYCSQDLWVGLGHPDSQATGCQINADVNNGSHSRFSGTPDCFLTVAIEVRHIKMSVGVNDDVHWGGILAQLTLGASLRTALTSDTAIC